MNGFPATMVIELQPELDSCFGLGPYTLFKGKEHRRTKWGELLYQAKYNDNQEASRELLHQIEDFLRNHPQGSLREVDGVVAPPKSDHNTPDLVGSWVREISRSMGLQELTSYKTRATEPQKNGVNTLSEQDSIDRVRNSISVNELSRGSRILVLDDTIGTGGTLKETARALREAGAERVYGLAVAKDAVHTQGGRDFLQEAWWKC